MKEGVPRSLILMSKMASAVCLPMSHQHTDLEDRTLNINERQVYKSIRVDSGDAGRDKGLGTHEVGNLGNDRLHFNCANVVSRRPSESN